MNQQVARLLLERLGQQPDIVSNGVEAVEALRRATYDLVLMDVQMPVMDGLEATRVIRAELPRDRQPRIVAMTANALAHDRDASLEAGMDDHLTKPVRTDELATALARTAKALPELPEPLAPSGGVTPPADVVVIDPEALEAITGHLGQAGAGFRTSLISAWVVDAEQQVSQLWRRSRAGRPRCRGGGRPQLPLGQRRPRGGRGGPLPAPSWSAPSRPARASTSPAQARTVRDAVARATAALQEGQ